MEATAVTVAGRVSRWRRIKGGLTPSQWRTVAGMAVVVLALHLLGFFLLFALVVPSHLSLGTAGLFTVGVGITAYTLGLRHAFDADHIGAIDNTTRKLMTDGQRPLASGSSSRSATRRSSSCSRCLHSRDPGTERGGRDDGSRSIRRPGDRPDRLGDVPDRSSGCSTCSSWSASSKIFRRMRGGDYDEAELEHQLDNRGFMNRFYGRATNAVTKPWQMYPIGMLFGLGFDTATEIALLATAGAAAAGGLPIYAILCLPILFAAGMSLLDTIDGAFMNFAYGWAFSKPVRKIFYNMTITGLSVVVALVIGTIELIVGARRQAQPDRTAVGLRLRARPQLRRLRDRRAVRPHLGRRAGHLALRPDRGALVGGDVPDRVAVIWRFRGLQSAASR